MEFQFDKYEGAGNDFIILEDLDSRFPEGDSEWIHRLCDRHFGIGADGLILVRTSDRSDFRMLYYNSDGRPSTLCGNGGRCVFAFAHDHNLVGAEGTFEASDGIHRATMLPDGSICLEMSNVKLVQKREKALFLDTGSPHHVEWVEAVDSVDVQQRGAAIRYGAPYFDVGSNVNFVQQIGPVDFKIRTYERGVEGETLACGTGAVAAAIAAHFHGLATHTTLNIHALGGKLMVSFTLAEGMYQNVQLTGAARCVFSGNFSR
jgi:diaminopimelate epimerase